MSPDAYTISCIDHSREDECLLNIRAEQACQYMQAGGGSRVCIYSQLRIVYATPQANAVHCIGLVGSCITRHVTTTGIGIDEHGRGNTYRRTGAAIGFHIKYLAHV